MPFISSVRGSYGAQGRFGRRLGAIVATGGDVVGISGGYKYHKFNSNGTFNVSGSAGTLFQVIIVGAGGNGNSGSSSGPGGGAGALYSNTTFSLPSGDGNYSITIGQPGSLKTTAAALPVTSEAANARGGNTSAFGITAVGGGGAGTDGAPFNLGPFGNFSVSIAGDGGSGAGGYNGIAATHPDGSIQNVGRTVVSGTNWFGNNSGDGDSGAGGGGGGAGGAGANGVSGTVRGNGGLGLEFNWTGSTEFLAGGGGGGTGTLGSNLWGLGGSGVGGNGGEGATSGGDGVINTGSGGGGSGSGTPGFGSSGTVWIRYGV
jgi:hypothetical protein